MKSSKQGCSCVLLLLILPFLVAGMLQPDCVPITEWKQNETECLQEIQLHVNETAGCKRLWDQLLCWPDADPGDMLSFTCPGIIFHFTKKSGVVKRSCTDQGWSDPIPPYSVACSMEDDVSLDELSFFSTIQTIYTVGYSISTISLAVAILILLAFRRLRCPRNYIHVHLFITFILKAISIFIKDAVLLESEGSDYCTYSTAGCKISMVLLHYFTMANFMWLLAEALYLNWLLLSSFPHGRKYYWWLVLFGWGVPTFFTMLWAVLKLHFENDLCWDMNQGSPYWWVIQGPIMLSVGVNFILFINILQILLKKLNPRKINLNSSFQYRRLSKSTLLLIPLFGTHYIIFNFLPENTQVGARLFLELCIGSFQGFIVAVLYCFLNQEVQTEICRKWQGNNYEFMMSSWRKKPKWVMPSTSGIKVATSMLKN